MDYKAEMFELVKEVIKNAIAINAQLMQRWPIVEVGKKYNRATLNMKWNLHSPGYDEVAYDKNMAELIDFLPVYAILESIFGVGNGKDYCLRKEEDRYDVTYYIDDMVHAKLLNRLDGFNEKQSRW